MTRYVQSYRMSSASSHVPHKQAEIRKLHRAIAIQYSKSTNNQYHMNAMQMLVLAKLKHEYELKKN